jgi:hypothetical protein
MRRNREIVGCIFRASFQSVPALYGFQTGNSGKSGDVHFYFMDV